MKSLLAAFSMLTCIPVGKYFSADEDSIRNAACWFPFAGGVIGMILGCFSWLILQYISLLPGLVLLVFLSEFLTKAFHLDGLADTADGFFSSRKRERILEIMHDSRVGTMGVLAMLFWGMIKFSAFAELVVSRKADPLTVAFIIFLMSFNGRCGMIFHLFFCRYAREDGLGKLVFEKKPYLSLPVMIFCVFLILLFPSFITWNMLYIFLIPPIFAFFWSLWCRKMIGGGTGDTLGGCEELTEILTLLFFVC